MEKHRGARAVLYEQLDVVHPRVVRAQIASADEHHRGRLAIEAGAQPRDVGHERLRRELDLPGRGAQHLGNARLEWTEVDAVRARLEAREREPVRPRPERVTVRARTEHEVEKPLGSAPW